jgi:hypothetical protein
MRRAASFVLLSALAAAAPGLCADKPSTPVYRLQWRDLDRATRGHRIWLVLPSGIRLEGDVVSVGGDELVLDVRSTSDKRAYPRGRAVVPRPEVQRFRMRRKQTHTWTMVGAGIGAAIGGVLAGPIASATDNLNGNPARAAVLTVAIPTAVGALLGWGADSASVEVVVDPGPDPVKNQPF